MSPMSACSGRKESTAIRTVDDESLQEDSVHFRGHGGTLACATDRITSRCLGAIHPDKLVIRISSTRTTIRTESEQSAVAVLHDKFATLPRHVPNLPNKLHPSPGVLRVKHIRVFDEDVCIQQFVGVLIRI